MRADDRHKCRILGSAPTQARTIIFFACISLAIICAALADLEGGDEENNSGRRLQYQQQRMLRLVKLFNVFTADDNAVVTAIRGILYALYFVCGLVFAVQYKRMVVDKMPQLTERMAFFTDGFTESLFSCCGSMQMCLHVCCCFACRASHTWHVAGVANYWAGVLSLCLCMPCSCFFGGYFRGKLREKFSLAPGGLQDFVIWIPCCALCAAGQEAIKVDGLAGAQVSCCCRVQFLDSPQGSATSAAAVVGEPVGVAAKGE
eukprot:TRINITY_DN51769_c0_g1_i1.p1 TRINITY_DN51769_c0_g1~~TRINITY_DN51769_c0_g1_i1.p1  ORF type:complete len:272 (-),score=20.22 TRINITY_DN51769_c0_g1_i1:37-816(-)